MASDLASSAVWEHLPPISGRVGLMQSEDTSKVDQSPHLAMLKPAQKHMQTIEGKRAMLIMNTCVSKVLLVAAFPQIVANIKHYELLLGREVKVLFREYERISTEYEVVVNASSTEPTVSCQKLHEMVSKEDDFLRRSADSKETTPVKVPIEPQKTGEPLCLIPGVIRLFLKKLQVFLKRDVGTEEDVLKDRLFDVTRQITRCIVAEPVVTAALIRHYREWRVEPGGPMRELASQLVQLRFILRQVLLVSSHEIAARDEYIERAEKQGAKQGATLQRLIDRLEVMTQEHNKVSEEKIREIERLNACLLSTEERATETIAEMQEKFIKEHKEARKKHKKTMQILSEDSAAAKKMYEEESAAFRKRELAIRRQKWRLEDQLESIVKKMDDQLFELQTKYDEAKRQYDEELKAYEFLTAKFEPLKVEYDAIMEARAKEEEARLQAIKEQDEMIKSATFITSLYRAFKARKRIKAERKGRKF
ncbi:IQ domain-containing protein D [Echinococcus granulosus]|uniref:Dynein regulatory complex protein 10 n=1 Tax=Echinococcus granulosus TaxID=6210 RepID=W6UI80_ECHGR|nr:IQ domain-containing protein D [Echinococcus granulosus]EUB61180.1 IQ domain-containing protein D [Echinococcus granulosus]